MNQKLGLQLNFGEQLDDEGVRQQLADMTRAELLEKEHDDTYSLTDTGDDFAMEYASRLDPLNLDALVDGGRDL